MIESRALIKTENASKYLQQLSKHWIHKFTTLTYSETEAHIPFREDVDLRMFAQGPELAVELITPDEETALKIEGVFDSHIERFAFRETLIIKWHRKTKA